MGGVTSPHLLVETAQQQLHTHIQTSCPSTIGRRPSHAVRHVGFILRDYNSPSWSVPVGEDAGA